MRKKTCLYKTIAEELGIEWSQARRRLPPILRQVSEMEHEQGRPLLTATVVSQKGKCGDGFFAMARGTGFEFVDDEKFEAVPTRFRVLARQVTRAANGLERGTDAWAGA